MLLTSIIQNKKINYFVNFKTVSRNSLGLSACTKCPAPGIILISTFGKKCFRSFTSVFLNRVSNHSLRLL